MGKLVTGFFGVVVVLILVLLIAPFLIPVSAYKDEILQQARNATGREVEMGDDISLALFPSAKLKLSDVLVGNAPTGKAPYFAKIGQLDVGVDLFALLGGRVDVQKFVVSDADLHFETLKDGSGNWEFESSAPADSPSQNPPQNPSQTPSQTPSQSPSQQPGETPPAPDQKSGSSPKGKPVENIRLGDIRIENSNVHYYDARGAREDYGNINVKVSLDSLDDPLSLDGSLVYRGQPATLDVFVENPRAVTSGGKTAAEIRFKSEMATVAFDGDGVLDPKSQNSIQGKVSADIKSVRQFAAYLGSPIGGTTGFGPLKFSSGLAANGDSVALSDVDIFFDGMTGKGKMTLDLSGAKPLVTGALNVDVLDFNKFMVGGGSAKGGPLNAPVDLAQASTWSTDPINFGALNSFNARLNLSAEKVLFGDVKIGKSALNVVQSAGKMTAEIADSPLYDGIGGGRVVINAAPSTPTIESNFHLKAAQMLPFLTDAMKFNKIEGVGTVIYTLRTNGLSERQLISNLSGSGGFNIADGAYRGVDLANMMRTIDQLVGIGIGKDASDEEQKASEENVGGRKKTDFAELSGTYTVTNGVVRNNDLKMLNPFVRITGAGSVDLPRQHINYRLTPKVVGSIEGQGGNLGASGLSVPVIVSGPLDNPSFQPDIGAALGSALFGAPGDSGPAPLESILNKALGGKKETSSDKKSPDESSSDGSTSDGSTSGDTQADDSQPSDTSSTDKSQGQTSDQPEEVDPVELLFDILKDAQKDK